MTKSSHHTDGATAPEAGEKGLSENLTKTVSVIVPVWNGADSIERCIAALLHQSYPAYLVDIIVVDNGSTDDTVNRVPIEPRVRLLTESVPGSYAARNRGLSVAEADYVAFTDADCVPDEHWLASGMAAAESAGEKLIWTGPIELFAEERCQPVALAYEHLFSFDQQANVNLGRCVTANWLSRRATIEQAGRFDATLKSGGDLRASQKICSQGGRVVYVDGMVVRHPARSTIADLMSKKRRTVGGAWMSSRKKERSALKLTGNVARDVARRLWKVAASRGLSMEDRIGLSMAVLRINFAALCEIGRLRIGGEPTRS